MKALLASLLLLLGSRSGTVDPDRFARAVWAESQRAPRSPREWSALLVAIAENESRLSQRIADGQCKPWECDRGRAKGLFQIHANANNRDAWARQDGDMELQVHLASDLLKRSYWTCARSGVDWVVGTINAYAGKRCNAEWSGLGARVATWRRIVR